MKRTASFILAATSLSAQAESDQAIQQAIQQLSNQPVTIEAINDTPVKGIKEVIINGGQLNEIVYLSEDGEHLFNGQLMSLKTRQNLTELTENSMRKDLLEAFKKTHKSIDFLPEQMTEHITVFTDIDCGYCRKLHQEIEQYHAQGIGVSYLFFPRSGLNTASHQKAVNVWCATDQHQAMTDAKNGVAMEPLMCPNPIETQFNLGISAGIHKVGTPAVVLADGSMTGYMPAEAMQKRIQLSKQTAQ
jgi:thiol:disulfide interchange protein DsbC